MDYNLKIGIILFIILFPECTNPEPLTSRLYSGNRHSGLWCGCCSWRVYPGPRERWENYVRYCCTWEVDVSGLCHSGLVHLGKRPSVYCSFSIAITYFFAKFLGWRLRSLRHQYIMNLTYGRWVHILLKEVNFSN